MRKITKFESIKVGDILKWKDKREKEDIYITIVLKKNKDSIVEIVYAVKSKGLIKVSILKDKNKKIRFMNFFDNWYVYKLNKNEKKEIETKILINNLQYENTN